MFGDMDQKALITVAFAAGVLLVPVMGTVAIMILRRRFLQPSEQGSGSPFALAGLQKMHESGQISDEEYKKLRSKMIENMQK